MMKKNVLHAFLFVNVCLFALDRTLLTDSTMNLLNDKGDNVLLCGICLDGWMIKEGYMLRVDDPSQHKLNELNERITKIVGKPNRSLAIVNANSLCSSESKLLTADVSKAKYLIANYHYYSSRSSVSG